MLFEVAIVELPKPKDAEESGAMERLVLPPVVVVARDQQAACVAAVLDNKVECDRSRMSVIVRPFA